MSYEAGLHHRAQRPEWNCLACGQSWPCLPARLAILHCGRPDRSAAHHAMLAAMRVVDHDLLAVARFKLYLEFAAWTRPDRQCRICGSHSHAVVPGVPPRLIPCDKLRAWMAGDLDANAEAEAVATAAN